MNILTITLFIKSWEMSAESHVDFVNYASLRQASEIKHVSPEENVSAVIELSVSSQDQHIVNQCSSP